MGSWLYSKFGWHLRQDRVPHHDCSYLQHTRSRGALNRGMNNIPGFLAMHACLLRCCCHWRRLQYSFLLTICAGCLHMATKRKCVKQYEKAPCCFFSTDNAELKGRMQECNNTDDKTFYDHITKTPLSKYFFLAISE